MDQLKKRLNEILNSDDLLALLDQIQGVAVNVDALIEASEKDTNLQDNDEYQNTIDEYQDELLSMVLELLGLGKEEVKEVVT